MTPDDEYMFFMGRIGGRKSIFWVVAKLSEIKNNKNKNIIINIFGSINKGHLSTSFPRLIPDGKYFFFLKLIAVPWKCEVYRVQSDVLYKIMKGEEPE